MKTIKLIIAGLLLLGAESTMAQLAVDVSIGTPNVNIHVGTPPVWGPVGYEKVNYYYLPDIEMYYDIRASQFIYFGHGKWVRVKHLPSHCRNYDLYHGYKVVLNDYHGHEPYAYFKTHKAKYHKGYKGAPQKIRGPYPVHYENHKYTSHDKHDHDHDKHDNGKGNKGKGNHK